MSIIARLDAAADTLEARHWRTDADERSNLQHALIVVLGFGTFAMLGAWLFQIGATLWTGASWVSLWPFSAPLKYGVIAGWLFYAYRELSWRLAVLWEHRYYLPNRVQASLRLRDGAMDVLLPIAWGAPALLSNQRTGMGLWFLSLAVLLGYTAGGRTR